MTSKNAAITYGCAGFLPRWVTFAGVIGFGSSGRPPRSIVATAPKPRDQGKSNSVGGSLVALPSAGAGMIKGYYRMLEVL